MFRCFGCLRRGVSVEETGQRPLNDWKIIGNVGVGRTELRCFGCLRLGVSAGEEHRACSLLLPKHRFTETPKHRYNVAELLLGGWFGEVKEVGKVEPRIRLRTLRRDRWTRMDANFWLEEWIWIFEQEETEGPMR